MFMQLIFWFVLARRNSWDVIATGSTTTVLTAEFRLLKITHLSILSMSHYILASQKCSTAWRRWPTTTSPVRPFSAADLAPRSSLAKTSPPVANSFSIPSSGPASIGLVSFSIFCCTIDMYSLTGFVFRPIVLYGEISEIIKKWLYLSQYLISLRYHTDLSKYEQCLTQIWLNIKNWW